MWLNFSEIEVLVLERLCESSSTPGKLSKAIGSKNSFISRAIRKLLEKTMIIKTGHEISLSATAQAQSFKKLYDSRPKAKIEKWLCGSAMDVLIVLAGFDAGTDLDTLAEEISCTRPTMFKVLKALYSAGIAYKQERTVSISDRFVDEFAKSYADGIYQSIVSKVTGHNLSIRVRKCAVLRTDSVEVPQFFTETGVSALAKHGMPVLRTSYEDYFFNLDMKKTAISIEEEFVHAFLLTLLQHGQDKTVLALFMLKNRAKLNVRKLQNVVKHYNVMNLDGEFAAMREGLEYAEKVG